MPSNKPTYYKEYYNKNKEILKQKNNEEIKCEICNDMIKKIYIYKHKKTQKCLKQSKENENKTVTIKVEKEDFENFERIMKMIHENKSQNINI